MIKDIDLRNGLWARHRCDGTRQFKVKVYFAAYEVKIPSLPGITGGCPYCWNSAASIYRDWRNNYLYRAPLPSPPEIAGATLDMVKRLQHLDYPINSICSHHGALVYHPNWKTPVSRITNFSGKLGVIIGRSCYNRSKEFYDIRINAVVDSLDTTIVDRWKLNDSATVVTAIPTPESMLYSMDRYRKLKDVFKLSSIEKAGFEAWGNWVKA